MKPHHKQRVTLAGARWWLDSRVWVTLFALAGAAALLSAWSTVICTNRAPLSSPPSCSSARSCQDLVSVC